MSDDREYLVVYDECEQGGILRPDGTWHFYERHAPDCEHKQTSRALTDEEALEMFTSLKPVRLLMPDPEYILCPEDDSHIS